MKAVSLFATAGIIAAPILAFSSRETATPRLQYAQGPSSCGRRCGVERWQIKTLSDRERDRVDRTPVVTTVEALVSLPRPQRTPQYSRIAPTEFTTYQIDAYLGGYQPESDGDIHLYLFGMQNERVSMIAEIPDPNCSGACASGLSAEHSKARATLYQILSRPNPADRRIVVRVTGVGFFDRNHGQVAAAPNFIELHPVLALDEVPGDPNADSLGVRQRHPRDRP